MHRSGARWWTYVLLLLGTLASVMTLTAGSASAHPFGDPEVADISLTDADTVRVHWRAGMVDDYTYLAQSLGVLSPDRETLDGVITPELGDPYLVQRAPELPPYLLRHVTVTSAGRRCTGRVLPIDGLASNGVDIDFRCAAPVTSAVVSITILADLSDLYRTVATGPDGTRKVYSGTVSSLRWSFDQPSTGHAALLLWAALVAVLVLLVLIAVVARRRRGRVPALVPPERAPPVHTA